MIGALALEAGGQIAQTFAVSELRKYQRQEMIISRESSRRLSHRKAFSTASEFFRIERSEDLSKNRPAGKHCPRMPLAENQSTTCPSSYNRYLQRRSHTLNT